jgi:hypothetical protein
MLIMSYDGPQWRCDGCQQLMTGGLALFRPLPGPSDTAEVLTVHQGCTKSVVVETLLPRYSSRPLRQMTAQLDDTLAEERSA